MRHIGSNFIILAVLLPLFSVSCGDDYGLVGQPCSGGYNGDYVCMASFSAAGTWELPCLDQGDCPDGIWCVIPPYVVSGFGVCDVGNRWAVYGSDANYITTGDPGYWRLPCYVDVGCGNYMSCEMVAGYGMPICEYPCASDIDCFTYFGPGSLCTAPYYGADFGYCQPTY